MDVGVTSRKSEGQFRQDLECASTHWSLPGPLSSMVNFPAPAVVFNPVCNECPLPSGGHPSLLGTACQVAQPSAAEPQVLNSTIGTQPYPAML